MLKGAVPGNKGMLIKVFPKGGKKDEQENEG